jgi:hypothetical protein
MINKSVKTIVRRKSVLERLEKQLVSSVKHNKGVTTPLDDKDKKRIEKEIETLKSRI